MYQITINSLQITETRLGKGICPVEMLMSTEKMSMKVSERKCI